MSQHSLSRDPLALQAYLLTVAAELQQIEASLRRMRDCTERLRAAHESPGGALGPLEQMYEDLERAIRSAPAPEPPSRRLPLPRAPSGAGPRKRRVALQVVPAGPRPVTPPPTHR